MDFIKYEVTVRGFVLDCFTIKGVTGLIREVSPSITVIRRYSNGVATWLNKEELELIEKACEITNKGK